MSDELATRTAAPPTPTTTTGSSSEQPSDAQSRGSSPPCWAANLFATVSQLGTVYMLGLPLMATFIEAVKAKEVTTAIISGLAFLAIVQSSSLADIAKVLTAAKGILPGSKT